MKTYLDVEAELFKYFTVEDELQSLTQHQKVKPFTLDLTKSQWWHDFV